MSSYRFVLLGLLPLILSACMNAGSTEANPSINASSMGVDLGSSAGHMVGGTPLATSASPIGSSHEMHRPGRSGEMTVAHSGHSEAQATGTVNAVNQVAHTINVSHGAIRALGWPPMTMDFPVSQSVDLKSLKPGKKVNFSLDKGDDGRPIVQSVTPVTGEK